MPWYLRRSPYPFLENTSSESVSFDSFLSRAPLKWARHESTRSDRVMVNSGLSAGEAPGPPPISTFL